VDELPPYDLNLLVPKKMTLADMPNVLQAARRILAKSDFTHEALDANLREAAHSLDLKPGEMFQPIRVAVCGKMVAPPLFETLAILGRERVLRRIDRALERLQ
jgi:glutamyl-tRNA synthetase